MAVAKRWQQAGLKIKVIRIFKEIIRDLQKYGCEVNFKVSKATINAFFLGGDMTKSFKKFTEKNNWILKPMTMIKWDIFIFFVL